MSEQPPSRPPAHEQAGVSGLLGQLFAYVDRPWKVAALVILFVVGGAGWIVYEKREQLLESWLTPSAVSLKTSEVPAALEKLVELTGADLVQIWEVDLGANVQRFIGARRHDGDRPVITARSDVQAVVDILAGHPACADLSSATHSPVVARLADRGFKRGCAVPIPPGPEAFVGIIYMAWVTAPEASVEDVAVQAAREIAAKLDQ
jgi:hypothetical protein